MYPYSNLAQPWWNIPPYGAGAMPGGYPPPVSPYAAPMAPMTPFAYTGPGVPYAEMDLVLDDEDIEENVRKFIDYDAYIPRSDKNAISVKVNGGVAKLTGTVRSRRSQFLAYADAFWAPGVIDVEPDLKVQEGAPSPMAPKAA